MAFKATPYANLQPDLILNAIESVGFRVTGSLLALNSYENRVYQIGIDEAQPLIAKFYRPERWDRSALLEEHQFALELADYEIPVVAPWVSDQGATLHEYKGYQFALFQRWGGRALELDNLEQLEWMGRFIGRMHAVGACQSFQYRQKLDIDTYGYAAYRFLVAGEFIPAYLKESYCQTIETALLKIQQIFQAVSSIASIRLHGDMHAGNVLWCDAGPHIVDLDDTLMGPAVQDIWMLLSGDKEQRDIQLARILKGYRVFYPFNEAELILIEALRTLRQLHYSAWLARRWQDPAFPMNFPWFNTPRYWEEQLTDLALQSRLLDQELAYRFG